MKISLSAIPIIAEETVWNEKNGEIVLCIMNKGFFNRILQFLAKKPSTSYIHLDKLGGFVWKKIDGNNSIYDIAKALEFEFKQEAYPLYERLLKYLSILYKNNLVFLKQ